MAKADADFREILSATLARQGPKSLMIGDILTAFGIDLFTAGHREAALTYLNAAVPAYREVVGPDDPEVALAINDVVDVRLEINPDSSPPDLVAMARETFRIRSLKLGDDNAETATTRIMLGRVLGTPEATHGDPVRVEEAASVIRAGLEKLEKIAGPSSPDLQLGRYRLAEVYAHNGRGSETLAAARAYWRSADRENPIEALVVKAEILKLADILDARGDAKTAKELRDAVSRTTF